MSFKANGSNSVRSVRTVRNWNLDLTEGSITKKLILFALPFLGSSLIQQLYNTVDLLFVGNVLGTHSYAAVGASSLIVTILVGFFTGMSVGSNVVISNAIGGRDPQQTEKGVHTALAFSIAGGFALMIIGEIGAPHFLRWMNTDPAILEEAAGYLRIYFLSVVSMVVYNMSSGIIRASGNSAIPLIIQTLGGAMNVAADAVLILSRRDVIGVAWATMVSQTFAAFLCLLYLKRRGGPCRLYFRKLRIDRTVLGQILKIGVPAGLQNIVITFSNIVAQYRINGMGIVSISAFTTYFRVELILWYPLVAIGQAMTTFAGQNFGAKKMRRIRTGVRRSIFFGVVLTFGLAMILLPAGRPLFALFNADPQVVELGQAIIRTTFWFYWIYVILEVLADTLRGCGVSTPPMLVIMANICVLRSILLIFAVPHWNHVRSVAATYPISWTTTAVCMIILYLRFCKTNNKEETLP